MAIAPSPNSRASVAAPIDNKRKTMSSNVEESEIKSEMNSDKAISQPQKRNSNPGVRVIRGRIYDSQNGTTCHQCRQKTYAVYASCKNHARTKPCPLKYCCTCLFNRYGEKTDDVALLEGWNCPKCRGVCNCSICMKKRGHQPTGMVVQMAKANGFSSVSDMIHAKGAQNVSNYKRIKETTASPRKTVAPAEEMMITSPKKSGKENLLDGKTDSNADPLLSVPLTTEKKPKKMKQKRVEIIQNDTEVNGKNQKKLKSKGSKEISEENVINVQPPQIEPEDNTNKIKSKGSKEIVLGLRSKLGGNTTIHDQNQTHNLEDNNNNQCLQVKKNDLNPFESGIILPTGSELVTIAGVDLSKEDAGNALQLLEFCSTFGKILDVKKGQAEAVLRDLIKGRSTRRGKYTSVIQFHIQLLSVIQEESESDSESESPELDHGNDSWLKALKNCISKSRMKHLDLIDTSVAGYDNLDSSTKLKLLVFLCDEVLETEKIRKWIDEQNVKFGAKKKEAKENLCAAKEKEKVLKQKMQDDIAKAIIAKDSVPLTTNEYDAIVSKIKTKTAEAHAEMLACQEMVPIDKEKADAVRTGAIFRDNKGHIYWRLKGCSDKPGILLQDVGTGDHTAEAIDKWFEFDDEKMDLIQKHIKILRSRFKKYHKN